MRELIIKRIVGMFEDELEEATEHTLNDIIAMSDVELLEFFESVVGFNG